MTKTKNKRIKNIEWIILVCVIMLVGIGLVALASATIDDNYEELIKQAIWFGISIVVMIPIMLIDYEVIAKLSAPLYAIALGLLVGVLFTTPINSATSWYDLGFFSLQPAELSKVIVILFLSYIFVRFQEKGRDEISKIWRLGIIVLILAIPVGLIAYQPDFGTSLPFIFATVIMLFVAGIKKRYIFITILAIVIAVPLIYNFVLPTYAKARIDVFLNPGIDPRGDGYNVLQSQLAIGAGQLTGMGLFKGNQTQLGYLNPKSTDFIFSVIGEELGFIGGSAVIILYVILVTKSIYVAKTAKDDLGSYIAIGIAGIFLFHMIQNIGMTMGLLPITGVPLPFVSYGGTGLVTNFIAIGLLLNISGRRQKR